MGTSIRNILVTLTACGVAAATAGRAAILGMEYMVTGRLSVVNDAGIESVFAEAKTLANYISALSAQGATSLDLPTVTTIAAIVFAMGGTMLINRRAAAVQTARRRLEDTMSRPNAQLRASHYRFRSTIAGY